jgi:hypothetical protein
MNSTELIERAEEKFDSKSIAFIGVGVIALGVLITWWKKTLSEDVPESELPPIIIKSGSFIIETTEVLMPDRANERSYKRGFINGIKGIRVNTYNELTREDSDDDYFYEGKDYRWKSGDNVKVFIELERCVSDTGGVCNSWLSPGVVEILNNASDLEIKVPDPIRLSKSRRNKKNKRQHKHEDEHDEFIRFTKVTVINTSQGNLEIMKYPKTPSEKKAREYFIAFYNRL